jgi:hypothetical protein
MISNRIRLINNASQARMLRYSMLDTRSNAK